MQIIISNTTEIGIQLVNEDIRRHPPVSFPGKLLAFLYERFKAFNGSAHSGMIIVPTELIPDNGKELERIVLELAHLNGLEDSFIEWLEKHNRFCNSLVDRIVPGKPDAATQQQIAEELGYTDGLLTMCESYRLWAIEGDDFVRSALDLQQEGVVVAADINKFRELKLRLLNGTHTLSCGLAFLAGYETVKEAMDHPPMEAFITSLMLNELAPAIPFTLAPGEAAEFGRKVLDRFRNGYIRHQWLSITMNYSSKMKMRTIAMLTNHFASGNTVPEFFTLGFAAYLLFMRAVNRKDDKYYGTLNGTDYLIQDEEAAVFYRRWHQNYPAVVVSETLRDAAFWGEDLQLLPGWEEAVTGCLTRLMATGARETLVEIMSRKEVLA
jgi:tagaturonate reductase